MCHTRIYSVVGVDCEFISISLDQMVCPIVALREVLGIVKWHWVAVLVEC